VRYVPFAARTSAGPRRSCPWTSCARSFCSSLAIPAEALTRNQPLLLARTRPLAEHETRSLACATTTADESRPQELRALGCALLAQPRARSRGGLGVQPPGSGLLLVSIPLSFLASASDPEISYTFLLALLRADPQLRLAQRRIRHLALSRLVDYSDSAHAAACRLASTVSMLLAQAR